MSIQFELDAAKRSEDQQGKGASRRLRRNNQVPAIIYGGDSEAISITVKYNKLVRALQEEAFFATIINLKMEDGSEEKVIIKDLQRHPAKGTPMHADFQRVVKGQTISMSVPVHFEGAENSPAIKAGATLSTTVSELDINCIPSNIPEYLVVDITKMMPGESLHLSDMTLPEGVTLSDLEGGSDRTVANLSSAKVDIEVEEEAPAAASEEAGEE